MPGIREATAGVAGDTAAGVVVAVATAAAVVVVVVTGHEEVAATAAVTVGVATGAAAAAAVAAAAEAIPAGTRGRYAITPGGFALLCTAQPAPPLLELRIRSAVMRCAMADIAQLCSE